LDKSPLNSPQSGILNDTSYFSSRFLLEIPIKNALLDLSSSATPSFLVKKSSAGVTSITGNPSSRIAYDPCLRLVELYPSA